MVYGWIPEKKDRIIRPDIRCIIIIIMFAMKVLTHRDDFTKKEEWALGKFQIYFSAFLTKCTNNYTETYS
jgi:hypothetical protein